MAPAQKARVEILRQPAFFVKPRRQGLHFGRAFALVTRGEVGRSGQPEAFAALENRRIGDDRGSDVAPRLRAELFRSRFAQFFLGEILHDIAQALRLERCQRTGLLHRRRVGGDTGLGEIDRHFHFDPLETADAVEGHRSQQEYQDRDREHDGAETERAEAALGSVAFLQQRFEFGRARGGDALTHMLRGTS